MVKPWDDTLKKLIHLDPPAFVSFLLPRARFIKERPYVLEQQELEMDGLLEVEINEIFKVKQSALIPLLPLTKGGANKQTVERMFDGIQAFEGIEETRKADLELIGYTLSSLIFRRIKSEDQDWLARSFYKMHDILRDTPIYQMILQEGREEGREEGIKKGRKEAIEFERIGLLNLVEARFPPLKKLTKEQAAQIESPQVLVDLMVKVGLTQSLEEAIDYLVNWKTIYKDQL